MNLTQYLYDWAFINDHKVFVNLDKENYWLADLGNNTFAFEHNMTGTVPDYDYDKVQEVMASAGYKYWNA